MLTGLAERFRRSLGPSAVVTDPAELRSYVYPSPDSEPVAPGLVVLPTSTDGVVEVVKEAVRAGAPVIGYGRTCPDPGTTRPIGDGVLISTRRMRRILEIDILNQRIVVEPGVDSGEIVRTLAPCGYEYLPDPFGTFPATVGDMVAERNEAASRHITGLEVVTFDGDVVRLGGAKAPDTPGYDLLGLFLGSAGTLGVPVKVVARLRREPQTRRVLFALFDTTDQFIAIATALDAAGIMPARMGSTTVPPAIPLELTTGTPVTTLSPTNRPVTGDTALFIELTGPLSEVEIELAEVRRICHQAGAYDLRVTDGAAGISHLVPLTVNFAQRAPRHPTPTSLTGHVVDTHELVRRAFHANGTERPTLHKNHDHSLLRTSRPAVRYG